MFGDGLGDQHALVAVDKKLYDKSRLVFHSKHDVEKASSEVMMAICACPELCWRCCTIIAVVSLILCYCMTNHK